MPTRREFLKNTGAIALGSMLIPDIVKDLLIKL
jgi:hypothetical protein